MEPFLSISKQALNALPLESFKGEIIVVDTPELANTALEQLEQEQIVGFDTETRPSFRKGVTYTVSLVQISTHKQCYLFRLNKIGLHKRLIDFIENDRILKIGLSLKDDFFMLHKIEKFVPKGFYDLQEHIRKYGIADISLQKIYGIVFDRRISKGQRLTNWEAATLTLPQQHYAALDAWACLHLYEQLSAGAFHPEESIYTINNTEETAIAQ